MSKKEKPKGRRRKATTEKQITNWHDAIIADYPRLKDWPGVETVALGWKERRKKLTSRMAVKIYVKTKIKRPKKHEVLPSLATVLVPIGGGLYKARRVPTDVVWHASPQLCAASGTFFNPALSGALVGVADRVGTYACEVENQQGQRFGLTAGHVVQPFVGRVPPGLPIIQPNQSSPTIPPGQSSLLGNSADGFFGTGPDGFLDFALLRFREGRDGVSTAIDGFPGNGPLLSASFVASNRVQITKFGALTTRTRGAFSAAVPSITIGGVLVTRVFEFLGLPPGPLFGTQGDSGALVLSSSPGSQGGVVGMLFATAPPTPDAPAGRGYVFPFERIGGLRPV